MRRGGLSAWEKWNSLLNYNLLMNDDAIHISNSEDSDNFEKLMRSFLLPSFCEVLAGASPSLVLLFLHHCMFLG